MSFFDTHLLTAVVFLPLLGALLLFTFPREGPHGARGFALGVTLVDLALAVWMWVRFDVAFSGMQLTERAAWIPSYGIDYALGVDGISVLLVLLTTFLAPIVILESYGSVRERGRDYLICLLLLQTGMLGAFVATDLFLFYVFWEVMLVPMYFLIGLWGGRRRVYATLKFVLYTMAGSLLMLVAILYTVWAVRGDAGLSFGLAEVSARLAQTDLGGAEIWLFLAFAVAFAIKVPMFPFHTWLPDAHVEAPTGGSVVLAGVLLKLGTFGFLRYAIWLFPKAAVEFVPAIGIIAVIGILYGALVAMVQDDLKRLVAYSSVSHLGFVMLGIAALTPTAISGSILQMVNHGISTGALFLLVGVIYERRHTRLLEDFGGLAKVMPRYAALFVIIALSSIGLPGLNGFVGEFLILLGTFKSDGIVMAASTKDLAWAGILTLELLAAIGLTSLFIALSRRTTREQVGRRTRTSAFVVVLGVVLFLVAPPTSGFAGGLLVRPLTAATAVTGRFAYLFPVLAAVATIGVILAAVYLLLAVQRVFFGPVRDQHNATLSDLSAREYGMLLPLVVAAFVIGLYPQPYLRAIETTVTAYTQHVRERAGLQELALDARLPAPRRKAPAEPDSKLTILPRLPPLPDSADGPAEVAPPAGERRLPYQRLIERVQRSERQGETP